MDIKMDIKVGDPRYLDPDGNPLTMLEWAELFEKRGTKDDSRWRKQTKVEGAEVSTVWLGLNHAWDGGPPLFWETMIFGGDHSDAQWRYSSKEAALADHDRIVKALREGGDLNG